MIDIENLVFSKVKTNILETYPKAFIESAYVDRVSTFPCISLVETDNRVYGRTQDLSGTENHGVVVYDCNIYTTGNGRKNQAKAIADIIDTAMSNMGFTRNMRSQVPNLDRTIYRITMRFTAIVDKGIKKNGNTVHRIYKQ